MADISVDAFAERVANELQGVPFPLAQQMAIKALRSFCQDTRAWVYEHPAIDLVAGQADYVLTVDENAFVHELSRVSVRGQACLPYSRSAAIQPNQRGVYDTYQADGRSVSSFAYNRPAPNTLRIVPTPNTSATDGIEADCVLVPLPEASAVPEFLYTEHVEMIENKGKSLAFARPKTDWFDPQLSTYYDGLYQSMIGSVRTSVRAGNVTPRHRVRAYP